MNLELPLEPGREERPFTIREVVEGARATLDQIAPLWLEGEVSEFKAYPSGHWYFTVRDRAAQLACVMFRLDAQKVREKPEAGLKVYLRGRLSVHVERGRMQFVAKTLIPTTEGGFDAVTLARARGALERDGLLAPERKRPLPRFPRRIGVVTSPEGAVWHDIKVVIARRWPGCELVLVGARVQGDDAPRDLRRALALADRYEGLDVLIVARGGGSQDDLRAFNDEGVARAVAASRVPTVSAVGHELDTTLTDLVADDRAPTPSAAAEKVVPDRRDVARQVGSLRQHLEQAAGRRVAVAAARLDTAGGRMAGAIERRIGGARHLVATAVTRMTSVCEAALARRRALADQRGAQLDALSPLRVLDRGYAVPRGTDGRVLRRRADFAPGSPFSLRVADGEVPSRVEQP